MEIVGSFLDEEWESLSQMFSIGENPNFLLHCEGSNLFPSNVEIPSDQAFNISQESSNTNEIDEALFLNIQDHNTIDFFSDDVMEEFLRLKSENRAPETCQEVQLKRKYETQIQDQDQSEDYSPQIINPKKKPRFSRNAKRSKKKIEEKKNEEDNNGTGGSYSSEDESAKTRAGRGSATDPQSLYARKRRERINERLRILQNLVPNGTKVDISTMLEEAVQYVKFLQLQIKLLSSDNLWMYAPLAYNGMDISMYHKICPNLLL